MADQPDIPEIKLDPTTLYREEVFTDRRTGTLRRLTPITIAGEPDPSRHVLFSGQTQLLTPAGATVLHQMAAGRREILAEVLQRLSAEELATVERAFELVALGVQRASPSAAAAPATSAPTATHSPSVLASAPDTAGVPSTLNVTSS